MSSYYILLCSYIIWASSKFQCILGISNHSLILVVSFDGFHYDYLNKGLTPNLLNLQSQGVHSKYMKNIFPTKTYPNHHSISTGLYAEEHGVLDNHRVYNKTTNKIMDYSEELFLRNDVVPIYTLNELQGEGRYSGSMMWPGSDYKYQNHNITYNHLYETRSAWESRVDEVISWYLDKEKPANLVMLYFDEPDTHGHMFGEKGVDEQIKQCDNITKYLLDQLDKFKLTNKMNLFVLSDHGMNSVKLEDIIDLTQFINSTHVKFAGGSPTLGVFPAKNKEDEIYAQLAVAANQSGNKFKIFRKADMPERWHYKNSERTPPLLALANISYAFQDLPEEYSRWFHVFNRTVTGTVGLHGYDNTESSMYPFFLAHGPLLKKNTRVPVFDNIDLYSLWCHMLKLSPVSQQGIQQSRGDFSHVQGMLIANQHSTASLIAAVLLVFTLVAAVSFILAIYEDVGARLFRRINPVIPTYHQTSDCSTQYRPICAQVPDGSVDSDSDDQPQVHISRESFT